jgi:glycosyltransferase involved in cell wall biosynthesis
MKVSVILTVLNEGSGVAELLDSLLVQSMAPDEIVVVDGGSRDDTVDILNAYSRRDGRIKVYVDPGVNIARGRNLAISRASGDILAVTDGGCRPERDWLKELVKPLSDDAGLGAVGGRFIPLVRSRFEHYCGLLSLPDFSSESQRGMFYGRSSAFRRSLWECVGGYPEWLYTAEDTLFAIAAQRRGIRSMYAPASVLQWRPRPTLFKMAKMFYLYGRGNGRIKNGDLKGSLYWLRYHLIVGLTLPLGVIEPWLWVFSVLALWHLFRTIAGPNLRRTEAAQGNSIDRYAYVSLITLTRNLSTNLGFVRGWIEYRRGGHFEQKLEQYLSGVEVAPSTGQK